MILNKDGSHYRIPLGHLAFFFKSSEFSAIVDNCEQLPEEQEGKANGHYSTDDTKNDAQNVQHRRAFFRFLNADDKFVLVGAVDECHATVVIVIEPALLEARCLLY